MNVVKPIANVKNESYKKNVRFNIDDKLKHCPEALQEKRCSG